MRWWVQIALLLTLGSCQEASPRQEEGARRPSLAAESPRFPGAKFREAFERLAAAHEARIAEDALDARAHADLAEVQVSLFCFGFHARSESLPKARAAAEVALLVDGESAAALTATGIVELCDWNFGIAIDRFERAVAQDPENARAWHWYALGLAARGRHREAYLSASRAVDLEPDALGRRIVRGATLYFAREFEGLREEMEEVLARDPESPWAHDWRGMALVELERYDAAIASYQRAVDLSEKTAEVLAGYGHALGRAGRRDEALAIERELDRLAAHHHVPPVQRAYVALGLGKTERAFEHLEHALETKAWELIFLREEPWFDPIRDDPRFEKLLDAVGLTSP